MNETKMADFEGEIGKGKIFERIIYDFVSQCRILLAQGNRIGFCDVVELFAINTTLFYDDKPTETKIKKLEAWWNNINNMNKLTDGSTQDLDHLRLQYAMKKFRIIAQLLEKKNVYPRPGEPEDWY